MTNRVRVVVTGDALYVANTGRPIDRHGVISIARQHLSTKGDSPPVDNIPCPDAGLVDEIRLRRLDLYRRETNDIREHASEERQTSRDYAGRALWELLQNADDAMAPEGRPSSELIGAKGLGFKSVLEITDTPEIHSGAFSFAFDPARSRTLLQEFMEEPPPLVFRLPHAAVADRRVRAMRASGFATVVKLPFRSEEARAAIERRLRDLPPYFLLLSQNLRAVEMEFADGSSRKLARNGGGLGTDSKTSLRIVDGGVARSEDWRLWSRSWDAPAAGAKRLSAAIAVRLDETLALDEGGIPMHVFYPTEELLSVPFLVHASLELRGDRNHLLPGPHDAEVLGVLGELARAAASDLPPALVLELFRSLARPPAANVRAPAKRIQRALGIAVASTGFVPVVGGGKVRPADCQVWSHDLAAVLDARAKPVREALLADPALRPAFPALRMFGAEQLGAADYASLMVHARCKTREDCVRAAQVVLQGCLTGYMPSSALGDLSRAPIWLTSSGRVRALAGETRLVRSRPSPWPAWLVADELDQELASAVLGDGAPPKAWAPLLDGRLLQAPEEMLVHCLAPVLAEWSSDDWTSHGWESLAVIQQWRPAAEFATIRPYLPAHPSAEPAVRVALARVARVPRGQEWVLATSAYASAELGGSRGLADYFRAVPSRAVVGMPPRASAFGRGQWKALLRYLGVSWEPKLRDSSEWGSSANTCSGKYWRAVEESGLNWRTSDWFLDFFPECMQDVAPQTVASMVEALVPVVGSATAAYSKRSDAVRTHAPSPFRSCADYQLRREAYLPCKPSLAHPEERGVARDLYWPGSGIRGITPVLDLGGSSLAGRAKLKALFREKLGVREALPAQWAPWLDWADELAGTADGTEVPGRVVRDFYEAFLRWTFTTPRPRAVPRVVCATPEGLRPVPSGQAVWLDDPRFAAPEVEDALLAAGLPIFPAQLDRGLGSVPRLGVKRATDAVVVTPRFAEAGGRLPARLANKLAARRRALAAMCEAKGESWRDPGNLVPANGLVLDLSVNGAVVATLATPAYRTDRGWLVNMDAGQWEGLAAACAEPFGRNAPDLRHWFAAILKAASSADVAAILREAGIPGYRLRSIALPDDEVEDEDTSPAPAAAAPPAQQPAAAPAPPPAGEDEDLEDEDPDDDGGEEEEGDEAAATGSGAAPSQAQGAAAPSQPRRPGQSPPRREPRIRKRPLYDPPPGDPGARGGRAAAASAAANASARGLDAEAWLAERLTETLPEGWVPHFNVRDDEVRESDVVLSLGAEEWHVEIKRLGAERLYWSRLEAQKAADNPGRYAMALMVPVAGGDYRLHWSWDPLADLLACDRRVDWVWADTAQGPPLPRDSWEPVAGLKRPERPPSRMNFAVQAKEEFVAGLPADNSRLELLWRRLRAEAAQAGG